MNARTKKLMKKKQNLQIVNKKARFDYHFDKLLTAGIQLVGTEVKAIRKSHLSFADSYCYFIDNELILKNVNIAAPALVWAHEPLRERKLLLKRHELRKLKKELITGYTIVPTRIFSTERGLIKVEIALAKGKKEYDKRETIKERDSKRNQNMQYDS
jgi:SsrA-binding protein